MSTKREIAKSIIERVKSPDYVADDLVVHSFQRKPYTCVTVRYDGVLGVGFSKVRWPDRWDSDRGHQIALGKAAQNVAEILS
jgi:hypothetical protein